MIKRINTFIVCVVLCFAVLTLNLTRIYTQTAAVNISDERRVEIIAETRAGIFDTNGAPLVNNKIIKVVCTVPEQELTAAMRKSGKYENFIKAAENGRFYYEQTDDTDFFEKFSAAQILTTYGRYADNSAFHIIGYLDSEGNGVDGIEYFCDDTLKKYSGTLSAVYFADALGHILITEPIEIRNENYAGKGGIQLTVDNEFQIIAESALNNGNIEKGAVVITDALSGEILASVSVPNVDRNSIEKSLADENSPFVNRALCAYPVGSVFKAVTAAAALENGITPEKYYCSGKSEKSGNTFYCHNRGGHGEIDLNKALAYSCNPYFIELSTEIGGEKILETAKKLGFGKCCDLGMGFKTESGTLPDKKSLNSDAAVGNFGFGQGELTATPLQLAACYSAIANGGIYYEPYIIKGEIDNSGNVMPFSHSAGVKALDESTCAAITEGLEMTFSDGTGEAAFSSLYKAMGKTATAQSGVFDENGCEINYSWFAGVFACSGRLITVVIVKENGASGSVDGAPIFKEISENICITLRSRSQLQ